MEKILGFNKEYRFLSNFWPAQVELDGLKYPSTEHAYQAAKTVEPAERRRIRESHKPGDAKRLGKSVTMRSDWEEIKIAVMTDLVRQKFTKNKDLKEKLLATNDAHIEETNSWGDCFWGVCKGKGLNHLGKILMEIREELKKA
jgi:N-glycosidase YbiA